ncbi:hypothetical protein Tco_0897822, partial [Tanacetum coccineum]
MGALSRQYLTRKRTAKVPRCFVPFERGHDAGSSVRILQKSQENGQNRTITDTGTELSVQKPGECYQ